jgi:hypothetical protein
LRASGANGTDLWERTTTLGFDDDDRDGVAFLRETIESDRFALSLLMQKAILATPDPPPAPQPFSSG